MAYVISDDCIACGTCIDECPVGAISEGDIYHIDPETCTECGTCADVCPSEAKAIVMWMLSEIICNTKKANTSGHIVVYTL